MAWIESHQSLLTHRKTLRAAALLRIRPVLLIGHLHVLWWWALDNLPNDGDLGDLTDGEIASAALWTKSATTFLGALTAAGFIDANPDTRSLHDWYDYAGKLNNRRAQAKERMFSARSQNVLGTFAERSALPTNKQTVTNQPTNQHTDRAHAPDFTPSLDPPRSQNFPEDEVGFAGEYVLHYQQVNGKHPPATHVADAMALERDFGLEACRREAGDLKWEKHPNYLRKRLETKREQAEVRAPPVLGEDDPRAQLARRFDAAAKAGGSS